MTDEWDDIICIDDWAPEDAYYENGFYPEGTREKTAYLSPGKVGELPLIPKHRYLFKKSRSHAPWQFWMEIIAYRVGKVMRVKVPPAFVGLSQKEKLGQRVWAALIEWFYTDDQEFIEGGRLVRPFIPNFNDKTGEQHNLRTILNLPFFVQVRNRKANLENLLNHWAGVLAFDTVIGNTDRHQDNWGVVVEKTALLRLRPGEDSIRVQLAPAYDNGTALAYEQHEEHFHRFDDQSYARRYLTRPKKARHHMRWSLTESDPLNFYDFVALFVREHPSTKSGILERLAFSEEDLRTRVKGLTALPVDDSARLTTRRLDFTLSLLMMRRELLLEALHKV